MSASPTARLRPPSLRRSEPHTLSTSSPDHIHGAEHHNQALPSDGGKRRRTGRVFTEEDEITLLKSFCKATNSSISSPAAKIDPPTFEKMDRSLGSKFTHGQVSDKLRRLRGRYRKLSRSKSTIKSPHDHQIYKIGCRIWGKDAVGLTKEHDEAMSQSQVLPHGENPPQEAPMSAGPLEEGEEEGGINLGKYPALIDECKRAFERNEVWKQILRGQQEEKLREMNDKFVMLKYEEAAVMAKKAELVQELTRIIVAAVAASCSGSRCTT